MFQFQHELQVLKTTVLLCILPETTTETTHPLEPWFFPPNFQQKAKALPLKASEGVTMEPLDPAKNRDFRGWICSFAQN